MEPTQTMPWTQLLLAIWPLWLALGVWAVWWLAARFGYAPPDTYEEPPAPEMTERERRYHEDNGWGR